MPTTRGKKPVSYKEEHEDDDDESFEEESDDEKISKKSKKIKKAAKPKKDTKAKADKKDKKDTSAKAKDKKKKKDDKDDDEKKDDKDSDEKKDNPLLKKKEKKAQPAKQKGYTDSQYEKYQELLTELNGWTNDQLKNALKKNEQSSTGNKKDLVAKVADGKVLGKIPRCPKCFGGRPKFDFKTGLYTCPGYRDDEDFKFCNKKYTMDELPRETWTD